MEYFYYQNLLTQDAQLNKGECSVQRLKVNIAYDGTGFAGFQVQVKKRTIQLEIEKALERFTASRFGFSHQAGRTLVSMQEANSFISIRN